jgi:hypothetical protein
MRACVVDSCAKTGTFTSVTLDDDSPLPTWISHSNGELTVDPASGSVMADNPYNIKIAWTPDKGSNVPSYTAVEITVTCEITSFEVSDLPADVTYSIWDDKQVVDLTGVTYTQVPSCEYTYTLDYRFDAGGMSYIGQGTDIVPSIFVNSKDPYEAGSTTVTMFTDITVDDGQG